MSICGQKIILKETLDFCSQSSIFPSSLQLFKDTQPLSSNWRLSILAGVLPEWDDVQQILDVRKTRPMMRLLSKPMGVLQHGKPEGGHVYAPGPLNVFEWVRSSECKLISRLLFFPLHVCKSSHQHEKLSSCN